MGILNEILVEYMTAKDKLIKEYLKDTYLSFIYDSDIEEIRQWSMDECFKVLFKMASKAYSDYSDYSICPWCNIRLSTCSYARRLSEQCENCGYGKRHGTCGNIRSTYWRTTDKIYTSNPHNSSGSPRSILSVTGMRELVVETNNKIVNIINKIENM